MSSSMLTGERRWVSARRGGMTVLGKVAVPKPVNLPSQRLENHGLDPNVEIVPKGTLSWGSRSSSASNAWGSPALSPPNTSGGTGSRPSSGGTGTRPSTAGSERSHEPVPNAWASASRPSSASAVFVSNQTSIGTRPRSADTRPGSSQLSRFAEPVSENSVAWGASGTAEKLGSSKINSFNLSSGDFPTLGSEKNIESHGREDHSSQGRPTSASGVATPKEKVEILRTEDESIDANQRGTVSTWRRDSSPYDGSGNPPSMEKWQRETHPYSNPNMPPQHFDHWHGAPVRQAPDGVWYRGPTGGPPYGPPGPPGPPGNYPVEPFGYYHPHLPGRPLANAQAGPRPGTGPGGYRPQNGDSYRPHMPDSYVQPVMGVRPGVYPGPVPYDGYYGPPRVGLCNSNERDAPVMGMATGPYVYGRYPIQNMHPDSGNFYARPGGYGPANAPMTNEHMESEHPYSSHRGPYKVLLKQHDDWEGNDGKEKREQEHAVANTAHSLEKGSRPGTPVKKSDSKGNHRHELVDTSRTVVSGEVSSHSASTQGSVSVVKNLPETVNKTKTVNDGLIKKPETPTNPKEGLHPLPKKNPTLMDKIESLNNKARISDDRHDVGHAPSRDDKKKPFRVSNAKAECSTTEADHGALPPEKSSTSGMPSSTYVASASAGDKRLEPTVFSGTVVSRPFDPPISALNSSEDGDMSSSHINKRSLGVQNRAEYRGKGRPNSQEGEEWRKKSHVTDSPIMDTVKNVESRSTVNQHATQEASKKPDVLQVTAEGEQHAASAVDPTDYKMQVQLKNPTERAKMREIATQRAKQLQKEEEERVREQKAKALAKLEELNRRAQVESSTEKMDCAWPSSEVLEHKKESSAAPMADPSSFNVVPSSALGLNSVTEMEKTAHRIGESSDSPEIVPSEAPARVPQDPVIIDNLPLPLPLPVSQDLLSEKKDVTDEKAASQILHNSLPKQKQMGYKRRQNIPLDKNSSDKSVPTGNVGGPKSHGIMVGNANASSGEPNLPSNTNTSDDPLLQHKKKNNKSGKNKHKLAESSLGVGVAEPSLMPLEGSPAKAPGEISKLKISEHATEVSAAEVPTSKENLKGQDSQDTPSADQGWTLPTEENTQNRVNHWKPQASRRMPRNTQGNRATEKPHNSDAVVWAPVRSLNKNEASDEPNENTKREVQAPTNGHGVQNHQKSRRAEMERYVPKPVAKEMSQQGNTQRPLSPSVNQAVSEATGRADSGFPTNDSSGPDISKGGSIVVSKNGEIKNNKHGKTHGLWRQRGTAESQSHHVNPSQEGSSISSDPSKAVQKPVEPQQQSSSKTDTLPKVQAKHYDHWNDPILTEPISGPVVVKEHGVASRGKRQAVKGNKTTGHNSQNTLDHKDVQGGNTDITGSQSSHAELDHLELKITFGEFEHSPSYWQPKSQPYSVHNRQQGNKVPGGQKAVTQVVKSPESELSTQAGGRLPVSRNDKGNSTAVVQPLSESSSQETHVAGVPSGRHQEIKRERKGVADSSKEHPSSPNQGPINLAKPVLSENIDKQPEQSFSSGVRKHGHQNARYGRGQEVPHGGRGQVVQDNNIKQQQQPGNSDRRRPNSHYEYQPAKSYNNEPHDPVEGGSRGGGGGGGSRYRERGQTHSRRGGGNFYGRNNNNREVSASYGSNGE